MDARNLIVLGAMLIPPITAFAAPTKAVQSVYEQRHSSRNNKRRFDESRSRMARIEHLRLGL